MHTTRRAYAQTPRPPSLRDEQIAALESLPGWTWRVAKRTLERPRFPMFAKRYRRLTGKQQDPLRGYVHPACDEPGCKSRSSARRVVAGGSYCPLHADRRERALPARLGLGTVDDWSDDAVAVHQLAPMLDECQACQSRNFPEERVGRGHFTICCSNGKTKHLESFDEPGPVLHDLLTSQDARAKTFRTHIRSYNAALSFMSVGAKVVAPPGLGPPVYKVHGSICHWTGGLLPAAGEDPVYAQLYIYDPAEALQSRLSQNPAATREIMEALQEELAPENCFAQSYRHMHELLQEAEAAAARNHTPVPEVPLDLAYPTRVPHPLFRLPRGLAALRVAIVFPTIALPTFHQRTKKTLGQHNTPSELNSEIRIFHVTSDTAFALSLRTQSGIGKCLD